MDLENLDLVCLLRLSGGLGDTRLVGAAATDRLGCCQHVMGRGWVSSLRYALTFATAWVPAYTIDTLFDFLLSNHTLYTLFSGGLIKLFPSFIQLFIHSDKYLLNASNQPGIV